MDEIDWAKASFWLAIVLCVIATFIILVLAMLCYKVFRTSPEITKSKNLGSQEIYEYI